MKILTVTELTLAIKRQLEPRFAHIQVKGEVTNIRAQSSGHYYFSLKDQGSQISAVLFKGNAKGISRLPKAGDQIIVRGELSLYPPRGTYQIIVRELEHAGVGELLVKLHQLKESLKQRGWLDPEHKKPLPLFPKTIGVVTSPTGSVIQDIIHVLKRRYPHFHLLLNPVRVQGETAAAEIAAAIQTFNTHCLCDVMIVGRGGGSLEDLWPFNEECVAEAIFHSKIPIISAVGHETDVTLADCVADVRAPTPSAAAEISVKELTTQNAFLIDAQQRFDQLLKQTIRHKSALIEGAARHPLLASPFAILSEHYQRVDDFQMQTDRSMRHQLSHQALLLTSLKRELQGKRPEGELKTLKEKLQRYAEGIHVAMCHLLKRKDEHLKQLSTHLHSVNPETILKKGYCIPFAEKGNSVMMSSRGAIPGSRMRLRFHDGTVHTRIEEVNGTKAK
ncbi:MAG: exodeoxyribonuclease VII large subunit [Chlamydiia bacterium]|nr:exodeoxyribonuclease VII large subunit [Chlamydiia bacterium]